MYPSRAVKGARPHVVPGSCLRLLLSGDSEMTAVTSITLLYDYALRSLFPKLHGTLTIEKTQNYAVNQKRKYVFRFCWLTMQA